MTVGLVGAVSDKPKTTLITLPTILTCEIANQSFPSQPSLCSITVSLVILYTSLKRIFGVEELEEDEAAAAVAMTVDLSAMNTIATTPMSCDETSGKMVYLRGTGILHSTPEVM